MSKSVSFMKRAIPPTFVTETTLDLQYSNSPERNSYFSRYMSIAVPNANRGPDYFKTGLCYMPGPIIEHPFRTIHISNLPRNIQLVDILSKIHGGLILSATLLDITSITGSLQASIIFFKGKDAEDFVESTKNNPIYFQNEGSNCVENEYETLSELQKAEITLIKTPTYPPSETVSYWITKQSYTRCLSIKQFPENISISKLKYDIAAGNEYRAKGLLKAEMDVQGNLNMEFSSVSLAVSAYGILGRITYRHLQVGFEKDPCDQGAGIGEAEELVDSDTTEDPFA
ncbi:hypothetical protein F5884DRAFT_772209 [Xylogone sp. PMI_703]|nr:hypothetical protein F5884DRAFT_772209 [Xylogone sp. PMI_703]